MPILAYDGKLALHNIPAVNRVRKASVEDVCAWLAVHLEAHDQIQRWLDAVRRP